jgi:hypothetical protein
MSAEHTRAAGKGLTPSTTRRYARKDLRRGPASKIGATSNLGGRLCSILLQLRDIINVKSHLEVSDPLACV